MFMIGIDPHKGSHTAVVVDRSEAVLDTIRVDADRFQRERLLAWAARFEPRTWAVEGATGLGAMLAQQLVAAGEHVVDVPAKLSSRVRLLERGRIDKTDPNDARSAAIVAWRTPALNVVAGLDEHRVVLRLLADRDHQITAHRTRTVCRLHALVAELVPGGIRKEIVVKQAELILIDIVPTSATQRQRLDLAYDTLSEIVMRDERATRNKQRITTEVIASGTSLPAIFGVGPILAAMLIGYTGDITRFPTAGHYAAYNGTAPVEFSSSGRTVNRLSRRGNRTLNHALHMVAVTQIRHTHSEGRAYYDRKLGEGKTPREARRALKRQISDRVYRQLRLDVGSK